ncbi:MAG: hypothetical protein A3H96_19555 [Acidobacteria bacterium RIFCSPLOWO2_02_FULL_67_36]|nr:MAG: hypothetical protein A3H96_19555 [Acidobacteria bacterium RIFCSPLOWO2_02_FULL_67_36]OFW25315.1 MAG: hypothetical protein A3G21_20080 [Acidobacteria bacterium RIFCSPLOWO2_12_FULL_66_21]
MHVKTLVHAAVTAAAVLTTVAGGRGVFAQTTVATLDEMRRDLRAGDTVLVTRTNGEQVNGRLLHVGENDLEIRARVGLMSGYVNNAVLKLSNAEIRSLERPRDSVRNGALIGIGVGGGFSAVMFITAMAVDRNEMDEWGPGYAAGAVALTAIGALIGAGIDAARSRPHIRFDAQPRGGRHVSLAPLVGRRRGMAVVVSF